MRIGPYEVLGELGRGGMGVVYRVRRPDGRDGALKLIRKADTGTLARFERERRLLASLGEDKGFVELLDAGVSSEGAWLVMPFVPGGTLRARLEAGPLGVEETITLGRDLATALGRAHERGIVHRDVKPENVLFAASGRALLADMGLAKHFNPLAEGASGSVNLTHDGVFKGTAGYMAPEQVRDAASVGPPADVFALGAVLHECLAGRPVFEGQSVIELLARLDSGVVEPIGRPEVPAWLENALRRALALDPLGRFVDGAAFARALGERKDRAPARARQAVASLAVGVAGGVVLLSGLVFALGRPSPRGESPRAPTRPVEASPNAPARPPAPSSSSWAAQLVTRGREKLERKDREGAIADCSTAIELDPKLAAAWATRGSARIDTGDLDGAIADLSKAIELDAGLAWAWGNLGLARCKKHDLDGAIGDLSKAIELDPGSAKLRVDRGYVRRQQRDWDRAIADFSKAIELDPRSAWAWSNRATAFAEKGDVDGVIVDTTKVIALDPRSAWAWENRGSARSRKGELDGAITDLSKAIELDPNVATAWANRGTTRSRKGDREGAISDLSAAIGLDPKYAKAWADRSSERLAKDDVEGALSDASRAVEVDPRYAGAWYSRAEARVAKGGDLDGAIADYSRVIELDPRVAVPWGNRGAALVKKGELRRAIADLTKAIELDPPGEDAARFRSLLEDARSRAR